MTLDNQIEIFNKLGYKFNKNFSKETIFLIIHSSHSKIWTTDLESQFSGIIQSDIVSRKQFCTLYYYLGAKVPPDYLTFLTNNCLWWDLEFFDNDGITEYIDFMKRMGVISKGEIQFENINCFVTDGEPSTRYITFTVNGIIKKWNLGDANYIPDSYILRFALLCEELKTKGKYTIYDDGGQQFVLDYATEEEQNKFNEVTKLGRIWLKDGNHFSTPIDERIK